MTTDNSIRAQVIHRLQIARGQITSLLHMIQKGSYCISVVNQSRAVRHALKEVDYLLLEDYLKSCTKAFSKKEKTATDEIITLFKNNNK